LESFSVFFFFSEEENSGAHEMDGNGCVARHILFLTCQWKNKKQKQFSFSTLYHDEVKQEWRIKTNGILPMRRVAINR
jgi:hypothetical protein